MVRAIRRTVSQDAETPDWYTVSYEMTPMIPPPSEPSGAFAYYASGFAHYARPEFPTETTLGNVIVAVVACSSHFGEPTDHPVFNDPDHGPGQTWTEHAWATTYNSGVHNARLAIGIYSRVVDEVTTTPFDVSAGDDPEKSAAVWAWELPATAVPEDPVTTTTEDTTPLPDNTEFVIGTSDQAGFVLASIVVTLNDYGGPVAIDITEGEELHNGGWDNQQTTAPWAARSAIAQLPTGGRMRAVVDGASATWGVAGVAVVLPGVTDLPPIPYPANQT